MNIFYHHPLTTSKIRFKKLNARSAKQHNNTHSAKKTEKDLFRAISPQKYSILLH